MPQVAPADAEGNAEPAATSTGQSIQKEVKGIARHGTVYLFAALASKAVGFLMIPLYTAFLSTADYGRLELLDLTATLVGMVAGMGISTASLRFYHAAEDERQGRRALSTALYGGTLFLGIGAVAIALLSRPLASWLLDDASLFWLFLVVGASMFFDGICAVPQAYMQLLNRSGLLTVLSLLRLVIGLSLNILFVAVLRLGVPGVLLGGLVSSLVAFVVQQAWLVGRTGLHFDRDVFWRIVRFGAPLVPSALATFVVAFIDRFFLKWYGTLEDVGVYSLAYKFGFLVQFLFIAPFSLVWGPRIYVIAKQTDAPKVFARIMTYWFSGLAWGALGISVGTYEVIPYISPEPFWIGRTYVWMIAMAYVFNGLQGYCRTGLLVTDRTKAIGSTVGVLSLLWVGVYWIFIWQGQAVGAAVGTLLTYAGSWIGILIVAQRVYPIPIEWPRLGIATGLWALLYATAVYALPFLVPEHTIRIALLRGVLVLAYPVALVVMGFLRPEERAVARAWVTRWRRGTTT